MTKESKAKLSLARMGHKQSDLAIEKQKAAMRLKPTKTMYKGVRKRGNTWQARIAIDGKELYLGSFDNPIDAAKNFDYHSLRLFDDCYLNFPHYDYLTFEPKYRKTHDDFTKSA